MKKSFVILVGMIMMLAVSGIAFAQPSSQTTATPEPTKTKATATPRPSGMTASATLRDAKGTVVGTATLTDQGDNGVLIDIRMNGKLNMPGSHAVQIRDIGACTPTIDASGGVFNPIGRTHPGEAGVLPNIDVQANGKANYINSSNRFSLSPGGPSLFDFNGSSLVILANAEKMTTDASRNTETPIACGVIVTANGVRTSGVSTGTTGVTQTSTTATTSNTGTTATGTTTSTSPLTATTGVTNTPGAPTTLPVTGGGDDNGLLLVAALAFGVILLTGGYLLRRGSQLQ